MPQKSTSQAQKSGSDAPYEGLVLATIYVGNQLYNKPAPLQRTTVLWGQNYEIRS